MEIDLPAQLYTSTGKFSTSVTLNDVPPQIISYFDPERQELLIVGGHCKLALVNRGFLFADFSVIDAQNSPPLWQHKLTLYKSDGDKLAKALAAWKR